MTRSKVMLRNIASNWIGFVVNAGVTLALTPYVLHALGDARYGVWILTASVVGYYGLLDLGLRGGVNQYLTRYVATGDLQKAKECLATAFVVLSLLALLCTALTIGAALLVPKLWKLPAGVQYEASWCILIVGLATAFQLALSPFASVFLAVQRFDLANAIAISTRLLMAACVYVALRLDYGLIGVSVATCVASVVDYSARWLVATRLVPALAVSWRHFKGERLREIAAFGAWSFLIAVNGYVCLHAQPLLIGALMPIAAVGYFALATGLSRQIAAALSPIGHVFYPAAVELHTRGDRATLQKLYHDGSRLLLLGTVSITMIAGTWAEDFYRLWIGERYVSGSEHPSVASLLQLLLIATVATYFSNIAGQILTSSGHVRLLASLLVCGSLTSLTLTVLLIEPYGLFGAAVATVIASLAIDLIAIPLALQRAVGLKVSEFVRSACGRPAAVAILLMIVLQVLHRWGDTEHWAGLTASGAIGMACAIALIVSIGLKRSERQRFLSDPARRLVAWAR